MMKKSILFVVSLVCILMMVGCNNSKKSKQSKQEVKKIKILGAQPQFQATYEKYAKKFEEEYNVKNPDEKILIEIESYPQSQYTTLIKSKLASGDQVDVFQIHAGNELGMYVKTGYLEDLSNSGIKQKLIPAVAKGLTLDNKFYGLPLETASWGILYNQDIFNELGLKPAMTLDELKSHIQKIKAAGKTPFLLSYKESWIPQLFNSLTVGAASATTNQTFIDDMNNNSSSYKAIADKVFPIMDLVNSNGNKNALDIGGVDGSAEFASGKYAMWVQGPWFAPTILDVNKDIKFGVAPLPIDNNPAHTLINQTASMAFVINKNSKNKVVLTEFLNYLLKDEITNDFYTELKFNQVALNHTYEMYPWVNEAVNYVKNNQAYLDPQMPQPVKDEASKVFQAYYSGAMSQEEVIYNLDNAWKISNANQ